MIQKIGDYYIFEQGDKNINQQLKAVESNSPPISEKYQISGNIKERIELIRHRFQKIKSQKLQQDKRNPVDERSIFDKLRVKQTDNKNNIEIEIHIPEEVLKLDLRISQIESKLNPNQIFKRKMDKKGALVDRVQLLHHKLTQIIEKSSQIIIGNIQTYCSALQDKDQYLKIIFLKQALGKTQGLKQQILVLEKYLHNLDLVQTKIKSIENIGKTVANHNQLLALNSKLSQKICTLFEYMKSEYEIVCKQIDEIDV